MQRLVLDTNIVLDLFVFEDPQVLSLKTALEQGGVHWLATHAMRDELSAYSAMRESHAGSPRWGARPQL